MENIIRSDNQTLFDSFGCFKIDVGKTSYNYNMSPNLKYLTYKWED